MEKYHILSELVHKQLPTVPDCYRLKVSDMKRITKNVDTSVFNPEVCCLWCSYVSNVHRPEKGISVQFFFEGRKVQLHRLLFVNYISVAFGASSYLKKKCGTLECVNVSHYYSVKYLREPVRRSGRTTSKKKIVSTKTPKVTGYTLKQDFDIPFT